MNRMTRALFVLVLLGPALPGATLPVQAIPHLAPPSQPSGSVLYVKPGPGRDFSFAAWVYWRGGSAWQRIFDFGQDASHNMFLTPMSGSNTLRFAITTDGGQRRSS